MVSSSNKLNSSVPGNSSSPRAFATTSWSVVLKVADSENPSAAQHALAALCETYWFPLYSFARRKGNSPDESADLTQAFFAFLLEKDSLKRADQKRGRFRNFLLTAFANFMNNQWRTQQTQKRGGGQTAVSIDFDFESAHQRYSSQPSHEMTPEKIFERDWAIALLERTMQHVQKQYEDSGRAKLFVEIKGALGGHIAPYQEIADRLEIQEGAVKVAVHRLRQRYGEQLRLQIAHTIDDPDETDDELKSLFSALNLKK